MRMATGPVFRDRGVRALVLLHEEHLRRFLAVWRRARAAGLALPASEDPNYRSLATLLRHVLRAARGYLTWTCEKLDLRDPGVPPTPEPEEIEAVADETTEEILDRWRAALREVPGERLEDESFPARWGPPYTIDAMLEHAVMHPIRHAFQLQELLAAAAVAAAAR